MPSNAGDLRLRRIKLKQLICQLFEELSKKQDDMVENITSSFEKFKSEFQNIENHLSIDYADECRQFAYIFRYLPFRYLCVEKAIDTCDELKSKILRGGLQVISLGGGPGTDTLAISSFESEESLKSYYGIFDICKSWELLLDYFSLGLNKEINLVECDVLQTSDEFSKTLQGADIISISFLVSEIYFVDPTKCAIFLGNLFNSLSFNSHLVFLDFYHEEYPITDILNRLAKQHKCTEVYSHQSSEDQIFDTIETKSFVGELWQKFPDGERRFEDGKPIYWQPQGEERL
jgi:hypothetical protein